MSSLPPVLPSHDYLEYLGEAVLAKVPPEMAEAGTDGAFLDAMGELALGLAHRPVGRWAGSADELRAIMAGVMAIEGGAVLEIAEQVGLMKRTPEGLLYPADIQQLHWLGARRTWMTDDANEYMQYRFRGPLWEIFTMAVASHEDDAQAAGLVDLMARDADIWDDQLHLADMMAAEAVAWGAECELGLRTHLVRRALAEWSGPDAPASGFDTAAALLGAEAEYGPHSEEVLESLNERLDEIVALLEEHPDADVLQLSLETHLCAVVRVIEDYSELDELVERTRGRSPDVANALARAWPPSEGRDEALVYLASHGVQQGDLSAISALAAVTEHADPGALDLALAGLQMLIDDNQDEQARIAAEAVCEAVACWDASEDRLAHRLAQLVIAGVAPPARLAAAHALSTHEGAVAAYRDTLLETLELNFEAEEPPVRAGIVGAALQLHTEHPGAAAIATALVADGVPVDVIAPFIDEGIRGAAAQAGGLAQLWSPEFEGGEAITMASMMVLDHVGEMEMTRVKTGPYAEAAALPFETRELIVRYLTELAEDMSEPLRAGQANLSLGWFLHGDEAHAQRVLRQYGEVEGSDAEGIYVLALGATGSPTAEIVGLLGRVAAEADPTLAGAATSSLSMLLTVWHEADPLEPFIDRIVERAKAEDADPGDHRALLETIAKLPTGGT